MILCVGHHLEWIDSVCRPSLRMMMLLDFELRGMLLRAFSVTATVLLRTFYSVATDFLFCCYGLFLLLLLVFCAAATLLLRTFSAAATGFLFCCYGLFLLLLRTFSIAATFCCCCCYWFFVLLLRTLPVIVLLLRFYCYRFYIIHICIIRYTEGLYPSVGIPSFSARYRERWCLAAWSKGVRFSRFSSRQSIV